MSKEKKYWVRVYIEPDKEFRIMSFNHFQQRIGICSLRKYILELKGKIKDLKDRVLDLEAPQRKFKVLDFLGMDDNKPHNFIWLKNRIEDLRVKDINEMILEKQIILIKHGTQNMFQILINEEIELE